MISKIIRIIIGLLGAAFGTAVYITLVELLPGLFTNVNNYKYIIAIGAALAFGIIFYIISPWILSKVREGVKLLDKEISKYPQSDILLGTIGLIVGLVIAYLIVCEYTYNYCNSRYISIFIYGIYRYQNCFKK